MKISGNTILITGGATGIGFSMAQEFTKAGNEVIICGRRAEKLKEAEAALSGIHTFQCDLSGEKGRNALHAWATKNFPSLNILVNNAGIQRMISLRDGPDELLAGEDEIRINLSAPIHLSAQFIPQLKLQKESAIVNVSSGLGFVPLSFVPVYCATKAAMHSFSLSLRHQLKGTPIKVFEIIPPTTDTGLDKGARAGRGQPDRGIPPSDVAAAALDAMQKDEFEIAVGMAQRLRAAARGNFDEAFAGMNR